MTRLLARISAVVLLGLSLAPSGVAAKGPDFEHSLQASLFMRELQSTRTLLQSDGMSLNDMGGITLAGFSAPPSPIPSTLASSPDGSKIAILSIGRTPAEVKHYTIRVFDLSGVLLNRFHPAVRLGLGYVSNDGTQIGGFTLDTQGNNSGWVTLDAHSGQIVSRLAIPDCCGQTLFDPRNAHLYLIRSGSPLLITTYDVAAGKQIGHVALNDMVPTWNGPSKIDGQPVLYNADPAVALSPDGGRLAFFDAERDRLTLVDTSSLKITATLSVSQPRGLLQQVGDALGFLPTPAEAKGVGVGAFVQMQFSRDGKSLYVTGTRYDLDQNQRQVATMIGLERIDVGSGTIAAEGLQGRPIWWMGEAADGSAYYALTPSERSGGDYSYQDGHYLLQRLDPATLQVMAQRQIDSATQPQLYVLGGLSG